MRLASFTYWLSGAKTWKYGIKTLHGPKLSAALVAAQEQPAYHNIPYRRIFFLFLCPSKTKI